MSWISQCYQCSKWNHFDQNTLYTIKIQKFNSEPFFSCSPCESASLLCIALSGENVHVRSVVIKEEICAAAEVEKKVKNLKDCKVPEERSFAFMFACIGRGKAHYQAENVESQVFRKHFPKTPLFGFFGNGEIGFNALQEYRPSLSDQERDSESVSLTQHHPKLHHAYTTILVLVSVVWIITQNSIMHLV